MNTLAHGRTGAGAAWPFLLAAAGYVLLACAGTPAATPEARKRSAEDFPDLDAAMDTHISPTVMTMLISEFNKDPKKVDLDFAVIVADTLLAVDVFKSMRANGSKLFAKSESIQRSAVEAERWFQQLADAAREKNRSKLLRVYLTREQICTLCHD